MINNYFEKIILAIFILLFLMNTGVYWFPLSLEAIEQGQYYKKGGNELIEDEAIQDKTKMICRLMGEGKTMDNSKESWEGDLGITFIHNNKLYLLTGDTGHGDNFAPNAIAFINDRNASDCLNFKWMIRDNGGPRKFFPLIEPDSTVPAGAISINGIIYIFMMDVTNWAPPATAHSILIKSKDNGLTFLPVWKGDIDDKFINVAPIISTHPLDHTKKAVYLVASGKYRNSPIYLAVTEIENIEKKKEYLYFTGLKNNVPLWNHNQSDAVPIVKDAHAGELSVQWNDYLKQWLLAYFDYRGIKNDMYFRTAPNPWGPWSEPKSVFSGTKKYNWYEYRITKFGTKKLWETPYGGYLLPSEYNRENGRVVYFVLSLWAPYSIFLMETDLDDVFNK